MGSFGHLIARNDYLELYYTGDGKGFILNTLTGEQSEEHKIESVLSKGVWKLEPDIDTVLAVNKAAGLG